MPNRIYFGSDNGTAEIFHSLGFDGTAYPTENQDVSTHITGSIRGASAFGDTIGVIDSNTVRFWDSDWNRTSSVDFNLNSSTDAYQGLILTETRIIAVNSTQNRAEFYQYDGTYQSSENITLPSGTWVGGAATSDRLLFLRYISNTTSQVYFYTYAGVRQTTENIVLRFGGIFHALVVTDNRIYPINTTTRIAYAYDFSRNRQSDDIENLADQFLAALTLFETDATLTLSTTDTDRRGGVPFTVDIDSDIDISGLTLSDVSVTNGAAANLNITDARNATVDITPDAGAGTVTVEIAADAVSPGNAAVSKDFTYIAPPTFAISFSGENLAPGAETIATIVASEAVGNLGDAGISLNVGTKGALTDTGDATTFTLPVTLPTGVTGLNTLTLTLAANAVDQGNAQTQASINFGTVLDRIFAFDTDDDTFKAFEFDGTAQTGENQDVGFGSILSAIATKTRIAGFDDAANTVRMWDLFWNRLAHEDWQPNTPANAYRGMAANDDDFILLNNTSDVAEFYDQVTKAYDSAKDQTLGSGAWVAATRGGDNLFFGNNSNDTISIRNLTGTETSTFTAASSVILQSLFATSDRLNLLDRHTGNTLAHDFIGTAETGDNLALGAGDWQASFVTFAPQPLTVSITLDKDELINGHSTEATLEFSDEPEGLVEADLDLDVGTLSNFSGSGTTWTADLEAPNSGTGKMTLRLPANSVDQGNAEATASIDYAPFAASWGSVPTGTVDNTFPAQLDFSHVISGLTGSDMVLRRVSGSDSNGSFVNLTDAEVTVTQIAGTNNYELEFDLTGTYDGVYFIRLRRDRVMSDGENYPDANVDSAQFTIDSDYVPPPPPPQAIAPDDPANLRLVSATTTEINIAWDTPANNGAAISSYKIDVDGRITDTGSTATTARLTGFSPSETVTIQVAAVNSEGTGDYSTPIDVTTDAEITISADDPIYQDEDAAINIDVSGDISGLTLAKITVTGATKNDLTENAADDYTLNITAAAGTGNVVVSIAEDEVSPGNAAVTKTFTRQERPSITLAITFDVASLRARGITKATITPSETATGLDIADLSLNRGTLSNFQTSGGNYTVDIQAPYTGSEITLAIRANAVSEGNAETQASIRMIPTARQGLLILGMDETGNAIFPRS